MEQNRSSLVSCQSCLTSFGSSGLVFVGLLKVCWHPSSLWPVELIHWPQAVWPNESATKCHDSRKQSTVSCGLLCESHVCLKAVKKPLIGPSCDNFPFVFCFVPSLIDINNPRTRNQTQIANGQRTFGKYLNSPRLAEGYLAIFIEGNFYRSITGSKIISAT